MKHESAKKSNRWIWLAVAVVVLLAAVGVALAFILPEGTDVVVSSSDAKLYWNVERQQYIEAKTGMSTRTKADDGMYHMLFAFEGEQIELTVADKQLVNYIDTMNVVGLVLSADNEIINAVEPTAVAEETARGFYVSKVDGNTLHVNSSVVLNGMQLEIALTENSSVYDVDPNTDIVGKLGQCGPMDLITVYSDIETGEVTHVYITEHPPIAEIYWRLEQKVNNGKTTRVPDENGVYTIGFAHDGQLVDLKCKDEALVSRIDSEKTPQNAEFALQFDDEGYIINAVDVALSLRGQLLCDFFHVVAIDGDVITLRDITGSVQGDEATITLNGCDIFMCCDGCYDHNVGERITELKMNDQVDVYTDTEGNPVMIFVTRRLVDSPVYYNFAKGEKREPNADGYYVLELFTDGKFVKLRTKDQAIVKQIDNVYDQCMALKTSGDIIEQVCLARCVYGGITSGYQRYVTMAAGSILTLTHRTDFTKSGNNIMMPDCKVYDMTKGFYGVKLGEETTFGLYDSVTGYMDFNSNLCVMFVTDRYIENSKLCWIIGRKYDAEKKVTTREPDENGYYVITVAVDGKTVDVKTKDKGLASYIDSQTSMSVALKLSSSGVIQGAYPAYAAVKYGSKGISSHYVKQINSDGSFTTYYMDNGVKKDSAVKKQVMADNCVIYNVSTGYTTQRGEKTKLQKDDVIQTFVTNPDGEIAAIFVFGRKMDLPLYWPVARQYDTSTKETTRAPDADGWYVIDLAVDGAVNQFKTKDKAVASQIDAMTTAFAMVVKGDEIQRVVNFSDTKDVAKTACGGYDVMTLDGNRATVVRNRPLASDFGKSMELTFAKNCKIFDVSSYAEKFGAETKIGVGDRVTCYLNADGEVSYCYISYKNNRAAGHISYCEHCGKEVLWEPYAQFYETDGHYYLTKDVYSGMVVLGKNMPELDLALDLNGYTWTAPNRAFNLYCKLSVMDSAGGGKISVKNESAYNGGVAMLNDRGTLNLYSGTLSSDNVKPASHGGVVYIGGRDCTFNMYGGTIQGGQAVSGGGNVVNIGGVFNMYGGTIHGGTTDGEGGNLASISIYGTVNLCGGTIEGDAVIAKGAVTVSGDVVINKGMATGLKLGQDVKLEIGKLEKNASIVVEAEGAFVKANDNAAEYASYFKPVVEGDSVVEKDGVLYYLKAGQEIKEDELKPDANGYAQCPVCQENVQWTAVSGNTSSSRVGDYKSGHYYLSADVNLPADVNNFATAAPNKTLCIHLNGKNLTYSSRIAVAYDNSNVNIMGSGNVTMQPYTGTLTNNAAGLYVEKSGTLNLYGGRYVSADSERPMLLVSNASGTVNVFDGVEITGGAIVRTGVLTLSGSAKVDGIGIDTAGKLSVKAGWTGTAIAEFVAVPVDGMLPEANGVCEDTFTGVLTTSDGRAITGENGRLLLEGNLDPEGPDSEEPTHKGVLELDADGYAKCPMCKLNVKWEPVYNGKSIGTNVYGHYYLEEDNTNPYSQFATVATNGAALCLHLNGKTLNNAGRLATFAEGIINVMGSGRLIGNGTYLDGTDAYTEAALVLRSAATVNIYGSTVVSAASGKPAVLCLHRRGTVNLYDATVIGGVQMSAGGLSLGGNSVVTGANGELSGNISVSATAKLTVKQDYTGTASVSFAGAADTIPEANGVSEGAYTGKLYLENTACPEIIGQDGRLVIAGDSYNKVLELDADGYAECPACKKTVKWSPLTNGNRINTNANGHYYLSENVSSNHSQFATINADDAVLCLHLNGKKLTTAGRIAAFGAGTINVMGSGSLVGTSSYNNGADAYTEAVFSLRAAATLNLYDGSYQSTAQGKPLILSLHNRGTVNLISVSGIGGVNADRGTLTLNSGAAVDNISVGTNAKLVVKADWNGKATVAFASEITDNTVPVANGVSEGSYDGKLSLASSDDLFVVGVNGKLVVVEGQDDGILKILGIGNSYTMDSMHLLYDVYKAENPDKEIVLAYLYRGGCSLATHVSSLTNDTADYTFYKMDSSTGGNWISATKTTMKAGIKADDWDIVTMQQNSGNSITASTYNGDIITIQNYVVANLGYEPEFAWNFTWGYPDDEELLNTSEDVDFAKKFFNDHGTTEAMYNKISAAVQEKIANGSYSFDYLMPVGTAVQNARVSLTAKDLYRDALHLNNLGRLIAAYTWYCELEGYDGTDKALSDLKLTVIPEALRLTVGISRGVTELDADLEALVVEAVNNAMRNSFAVTKP